MCKDLQFSSASFLDLKIREPVCLLAIKVGQAVALPYKMGIHGCCRRGPKSVARTRTFHL